MFRFFIVIFYLISISSLHAHPTGNMIVIGDYILWSYVKPLKNKNHYGCVMIWSPDSGTKPLITSEFPASDFMIFNRNEKIYLIESKYDQVENKVMTRLLKTDINANTSEIWPWFEDKWNVGRAGFFLDDESELIFCKYPNLYILKKDRVPQLFMDLNIPVKRIRLVADNLILMLGDNECQLVEKDGKCIADWNNLIEPDIKNAPLNRNEIFDVDYHQNKLLIAYWGKRSFEIINADHSRKIIEQQQDPWAPHWVAFYKKETLLFSSKLTFDGNNPLPRLKTGGDNKIIWQAD